MAKGTVQASGNRTVIIFNSSTEGNEDLQEIFGKNAMVTVVADIRDVNQDLQLELHGGREVEAQFSLGRTAQEVQDEALGGEAVVQKHQSLPRHSNRGEPGTVPVASLEEASRNSTAGGAGGQQLTGQVSQSPKPQEQSTKK